MTSQPKFELNIGLSDEEKNDLERMIGDFQREREISAPKHDLTAIQDQIDTMNERLAFLTNMFLTLDRRIQPLYETIRLTYRKSEILNQRINTLIDSIRTGEPL